MNISERTEQAHPLPPIYSKLCDLSNLLENSDSPEHANITVSHPSVTFYGLIREYSEDLL